MYSAVSPDGQVPDEFAHLSFEREVAVGLQHLVQIVHALADGGVGLALINLERAHLVAHVRDEIAHVHRVEDGEEEVHVHIEARFGLRLIEPAGLLEEHHAEPVKPRIAQRQPVLGFIHPEAARAARARGEEDIIV